MDAKNNQVVKGQRETHSEDVKIGQRGSRDLNLPVESESLIALGEGLEDNPEAYHEALSFMEEPVTIIISKSSEKNAPTTVQCWVNGKGAEHYRNGKWLQCGWLPIGQRVTTRRKYVEVLARARGETISTRVVKHENHEDNLADRTASTKYPFSVQGDSAKGGEWLNTILMEQ